jgi:hypothetical protein
VNATEVGVDLGAVMDALVGVREILQRRPAVAVREIVERVQAPETIIRAALGLLMDQGAVERLRPVFYDRDDRDYFRLLRESDGRSLFGPHLRQTLWMGRSEAVQVA